MRAGCQASAAFRKHAVDVLHHLAHRLVVVEQGDGQLQGSEEVTCGQPCVLGPVTAALKAQPHPCFPHLQTQTVGQGAAQLHATP